MKTVLIVAIIASFAVFLVTRTPAAQAPSDTEVVKALQEQNKQLARIAVSLERISGQQPGWKLPKQ